jgi:hypothetical protein
MNRCTDKRTIRINRKDTAAYVSDCITGIVIRARAQKRRVAERAVAGADNCGDRDNDDDETSSEDAFGSRGRLGRFRYRLLRARSWTTTR